MNYKVTKISVGEKGEPIKIGLENGEEFAGYSAFNSIYIEVLERPNKHPVFTPKISDNAIKFLRNKKVESNKKSNSKLYR